MSQLALLERSTLYFTTLHDRTLSLSSSFRCCCRRRRRRSGHGAVGKIGDRADHSVFLFHVIVSFVAVGSTFPCRRMWLDRRLFWGVDQINHRCQPVGPDEPNLYVQCNCFEPVG